MISLQTPIEQIPKVSKRIVPALKRLGIKTLRDLLFHFPARYENFSNLKPIREITKNEIVTVQGAIQRIANFKTAKRGIVLTEATIQDETGSLKAVWFNQPFLARTLAKGITVSLSGKVTLGPRGLYLQNPAYEKILNRQSPIANAQGIHTGGLVPVYPETEGVTSRWLRFLIKSFLPLRLQLADPLHQEVRMRHRLLGLKEALKAIHFPRSIEESGRARRRFSFEQMFFIQLRALRARAQLKQHRAPAIPCNIALIKQFVRSLPFSLTDAQRRSLWEILKDMEKSSPMNRLLEGDVGSGKTVVSAGAMLACCRAGFAAVLMAPTEILAQQHFATIEKLVNPFGITIGLMTGAQKLSKPKCDIIVGTHALIQEHVQLENLGLVVVDEQHRFGVSQRATLVDRGKNAEPARDPAPNQRESALVPHFLSMTATPIPRTLALTLYGDLDLSLLDEMPKDRLPVITKIVEPGKRDAAYRFIREETQKGRQVFVICPRIEVGDQKLEVERHMQQKLLLTDMKAVKEEYQKLSEVIFPDLRVGMLHGKMKSGEKERAMQQFKNGELDIMVSTSVVEVGVDIPNATIMMIEGAERFGLAQLHQFRGRVGRGDAQSYCFLFPTEDGLITKRLRAVVETKNGFELAEKDLEIRGPGDLLGTAQWGVSEIVVQALRDPDLIRSVREEAKRLLGSDPTLQAFPELAATLNRVEVAVHPE